MRQEVCAAGLLLLLIAVSVWNLRAADRLTGQVAVGLDRAEAAARQGEFEQALDALEQVRRLWNSCRTYTQIVFRHPDLDSLQDSFAGLEQLLRQEDEAWPAALALLRYHLDALDRMEHISLGTVF